MPPSRFADLDGPVHYVEWDGPPGRTFVLVHGLGGSLLSWAFYQEGSAARWVLADLDAVLAPYLPANKPKASKKPPRRRESASSG